MVRLVTFLGNPGKQYERTRHNLAWMTADMISFQDHLVWQKKFKGEFSQHTVDGNRICFLKPETFMNRSGESILAALQFFKIDIEELLVIHDDLELGFGEISLRKGGGLAGHNGLKSIARTTGRQDFYRFRMGISRPSHGNVSSYVLSRFSSEEEIELSLYTKRAADIIEEILTGDLSQLSSRYTKDKLIS